MAKIIRYSDLIMIFVSGTIVESSTMPDKYVGWSVAVLCCNYRDPGNFGSKYTENVVPMTGCYYDTEYKFCDQLSTCILKDAVCPGEDNGDGDGDNNDDNNGDGDNNDDNNGDGDNSGDGDNNDSTLDPLTDTNKAESLNMVEGHNQLRKLHPEVRN